MRSSTAVAVLLLVVMGACSGSPSSGRGLLQGGGSRAGASATSALDAALQSPLERGAPGSGGTAGGGAPIVGSTCGSSGPANLQGCCQRKVQQGTCKQDRSCTQARVAGSTVDLCATAPPSPPAGSQCSSRGPTNYVDCCLQKGVASGPQADPSCPPPACGALAGISNADLTTCCNVLKLPGTDSTCPRAPPPVPQPVIILPVPPPAPVSPTNVTCYDVTATVLGIQAIQANATAFLSATDDATQLRAIAAFGLQQMIDFFVNASTAVAVPGTSLTGRRR